QAFLQSQIGTEAEVLFETANGTDEYTGFAPNYASVRVRSDEVLTNCLRRVRIVGADAQGCIGELIG
ncbi:MAG: tRNA (N(6)-L-threonylcarbamoyladenosine(37)-C(2))-methylthiotransferase MtaB, partial [Clostridia bacterium]|nr:tRNA (N(6)-L-threonylcarbamoyladenosine(37)-C(2))-methylthiotransferase MtaB [Clostridia bacterium]